MSFFISTSIAATDVQEKESLIPLVLMLVIFSLLFYFIIFHPQQKRTKEHKKLIESIEKGDEILTSSGLIGLVTKITENGYITIALNDTTKVIIKRDYVTAILPKGTMKML